MGRKNLFIKIINRLAAADDELKSQSIFEINESGSRIVKTSATLNYCKNYDTVIMLNCSPNLYFSTSQFDYFCRHVMLNTIQ